jgi:hypothetical protein
MFNRVDYESENDLEEAILLVQHQLFGEGRIYLDVKRKIGRSGGVRNIPDGYLIDIRGRTPRLYVVENELARHDPLRHIAVQILQFSLSFEQDGRRVKRILFEALSDAPEAIQMCRDYVTRYNYRNLDHLLEYLVFEAPFSALVIIDDMQDNLENILAKKFNFGVEVLQLVRYANEFDEHIYQFEPFLADAQLDAASAPSNGHDEIDVSELDTVVVPARHEGFEDTFIEEDRWYSIRMHGSMRPQIKYIAVYRIRPISAITHIAPVASIEPWQDTDKFVVNFAAPAEELERPVEYVSDGRVTAPQNLRYTTRERLLNAHTLDDIW